VRKEQIVTLSMTTLLAALTIIAVLAIPGRAAAQHPATSTEEGGTPDGG
jgi:hypothetical protein